MKTAILVLPSVCVLLLSNFPARAETITGRFQYMDSNPFAGSARLEPIRFCQVEIWSRRPRPPFGFWGWGNDANTVTDGNGRISVFFNFETIGVDYAVYVSAENYAARVFPNTAISTSRFTSQPGQPDGTPFIGTVMLPTDVLDFSYDFVDGYTPQHWSMAEAVRHGFDYVSARRDPLETDVLPKAGVQPGQPLTFYNHITQTLTINNAHIWEDYTMLHEYAHFVEHQIGTFAPIASTHNGCTAMAGLINVNSPEHAWMEGFAEFFAQAVCTNLPVNTLQGSPGGNGTFTVRRLEETPWTDCTGIPANITPDAIENVVAGVLWDVADGVGSCFGAEAHDNLSGFATTIIQIMDREMDLPRHPTIFDFINAWNGRGLSFTGLNDILVKHGIMPALPVSLVCPANIIVTAGPNQCRGAVNFSPPTLSTPRRCATVQCDYPTSGNYFPIGTTTVNCAAFEEGSVIGNCSFTITVNPGSQIPNPNGTGLLGVYYDNADFTAPTAARVEAIDFDWGLGSPAPGVVPEIFSVRWSGQVVPRYTDVYDFLTVSDDGVRLWVNGVLIIDNWTDHAPTEDRGSIALAAGQRYDIIMEMYDSGGGAVARLLWSSSCQLKEVIPASHLLPARLECPNEFRPTYPRDVEPRLQGFIVFGDAVVDAGWLKLTTANNVYGIAYVRNFSGARPVFGFEASFKAALFGSTCCGNGAFPADGFSFNLVPEATVRQNPGYGEPAEEGLDEGLAINFDTWDNGLGEAPAIEVKWLGQVIARTLFQPSQSPAGISNPFAAAREVLINLRSDGRLTLSYGGVLIFNNLQTPYSPNVIRTPIWVLGARNGGANDNHWIRDLRITVNPPNITALYNTGVDYNGQPLADNAQDIHYQLMPGSAITGLPLAATGAAGYPIGPWLPDNSASAWIAPTPSTDGPGGAYYTYETYFDLNGLEPTDAYIQGWLATDDGLVDILLNGVAIPGIIGPTGFTYWRAFNIFGNMQPGANTLSFVVYNSAGGNNPTGLRVQMCGWGWTTPQLKMDIHHSRLVTTLGWGSLPHKSYFLEYASDAAGPWTRVPNSILSGSYRAYFDERHRFSVEPHRIYRVFEIVP